jgi:hypothetical protein
MKTKFNHQPLCELTEEPAEFFVYQNGRWMFLATNAPEFPSDYSVLIDRFFESPSSTVDWLAHLHENAWFQADDFFDMMDRFRRSTYSYGQGSSRGPG